MFQKQKLLSPNQIIFSLRPSSPYSGWSILHSPLIILTNRFIFPGSSQRIRLGMSRRSQDIIWSGFRESCTAKVVPRTPISSPHSGQAFVIFKTRDAADTAVRKLEEGCFILPNRRPLVASWGTCPTLAGKSSIFLGHLAVETMKSRAHRDEHEQAISTSHCSQPNTIEYDMAMEWCLLQTRSDSMWEDMYKRHGDELKKLKAGLNSK